MALSKEKIGSRLEAARKWRGVTRSAMAKSLDKSERTVQNIERGMGINDIYVRKYADVLEVSYDWLLKGDGNMNDLVIPIQTFNPTIEPGKVKDPGVAYVTEEAMDRIEDLIDAAVARADSPEVRLSILAVLRELHDTATEDEKQRIRRFEDRLLGRTTKED